MLMLVSRLDKRHYAPRCYVAAATDRMSGAKALALERSWASDGGSSGNSGDDDTGSGGDAGSGDERQRRRRQQQQNAVKSPSGKRRGQTQRQQQQQQDHHHQQQQQQRQQQHAATLDVIPRSREVGQSYATSVVTTLYSLLFAAWLVAKRRPQLLLVNGPGTCIPVCAAAFACRALCLLDCRVAYVESIARVERLSLSGRILRALRAADLLLVQWPAMAARFPGTRYAGRLY